MAAPPPVSMFCAQLCVSAATAASSAANANANASSSSKNKSSPQVGLERPRAEDESELLPSPSRTYQEACRFQAAC